MNNQTHNFIVNFIWSVADDVLRDVYVRGKYRDVILPMTVIRRIDSVLEKKLAQISERKKTLDELGLTEDKQEASLLNAAGEAFYNVSNLTLKEIAGRPTLQKMYDDLILYLNGFSANIQDIIKKFNFYDQVAKMKDSGILGDVLAKFTDPDIDLSPENLDNHAMGTIFEELLRRFNEENNEEAGEHWTPRDVVELMADLIFTPIADKIQDSVYTFYDGACGTGGMLTAAEERLKNLAHERGKNITIHLFGQEINSETYAIAKADLILKGDGSQAKNIAFGSTLLNDFHKNMTFDFMLSNPPYGKSWKSDAEKMSLTQKKQISDTRFYDGNISLIPRTSDGQLLFLLNNISKMKISSQIGSRIAEVHNGSSIFTGDAGSGESNARKFIIENDLLEAIIALPENMFYNTGINTFIWVLSNKKDDKRRGKIQLINAVDMKAPLRKNMGSKNSELTPEIRAKIVKIFSDMQENEFSIILDNNEFLYWSVSINRPGRNPDNEIIPFNYPGGIQGFMKREVLPFAPDAFIDEKKTQTGCEISFDNSRTFQEILQSIHKSNNEINEILSEIARW